jgi:hypothetical protein
MKTANMLLAGAMCLVVGCGGPEGEVGDEDMADPSSSQVEEAVLRSARPGEDESCNQALKECMDKAYKLKGRAYDLAVLKCLNDLAECESIELERDRHPPPPPPTSPVAELPSLNLAR